LLVFEFGVLNGGERSMLSVLPQFVGSDLEFAALAPSPSPLADQLVKLGVPSIAFDVCDADGQRRSTETIVAELRDAIRRIQPDLVHANSLSMGRLTGLVAARTGIACTAHLRDMIGLGPVAVAHLNANRALIAVSRAVQEFHSTQGIDPSRLHVVYNGIGRNAMPQPGSNSLKQELRLPANAFLIGTIGQISLRKAQDVFARGAALAARRIPNAHFLLVGQRHSSKLETVAHDESIDFEFAVAGLRERFHRLGYRSDVNRLLPELDVVVHCARQEPFGRVLLEAAAAARPIIATAVGGTAEMLVDEESALLIPPDSPERLASSMIRLYQDPALRDHLGEAARSRVAPLFTLEKAAHGLAEIWRRTIGG
jgi:glycosyltransferase involved in cell wall biosynthesis